MGNGIEMCAMLVMKGGKSETAERIKLPNQESTKIHGEKENYKCLEV